MNTATVAWISVEKRMIMPLAAVLKEEKRKRGAAACPHLPFRYEGHLTVEVPFCPFRCNACAQSVPRCPTAEYGRAPEAAPITPTSPGGGT